MPLKPLRSGEYPKGKKKKSRRSLALVFLSHSCASSKMVADAISERGEGVSLVPVALGLPEAPLSLPGAGVLIKESAESPAVGRLSSGFGINIMQTWRDERARCPQGTCAI